MRDNRRGMVDERVMFEGWDKERLRYIVEWVKWVRIEVKWVRIEGNMAGLRRDY